MSKRAIIEADLDKAKEALQLLQDELPQYHALLTDNERDAQRLKVEKASLDAQSQARGRVQIAKEMLEQHQSDIATAQAEVTRLEALKQRELLFEQMAAHAQRTTKHRKALEKAVYEGSEALGRALEVMLASFRAIREERKAFALLGRELAPEFDGPTPFNNGIQDQEKKTACEAVLNELEVRGAMLTDVLNTATGKHSRLDRDTLPLPDPENGVLLWKVFDEAVAKHPQQRYLFFDLYLPVKRGVVWTPPATTSSDDIYEI